MVCLAILLSQMSTARAVTPGSTIMLSDTTGFDGCQNTSQPSVSQMQAFWTNTPYFNYYAYIGGRALCGPDGVNASWINQVTNIGYGILTIWVGRSGNCVSGGTSSTVACSTSTAFTEGESDAQSAYVTWVNDGFASPGLSPALDIEAFSGTSTNRAAVKSYVNGWVYFWHLSPADKAVVYGSSCGSFASDWATISNIPDSVWLAASSTAPNTSTANNVWNAPCVPNGSWAYDQRYRQWWSTHTDHRNGVALSIDTNCADSWMSPYGEGDVKHSGSSYPVQCNSYFA